MASHGVRRMGGAYRANLVDASCFLLGDFRQSRRAGGCLTRMVYRNDVDALEARLANVQAELDAKTRARDEAAALLVEARARAQADQLAADWASGGPRRRRDNRLLLAVLGTMALTAGIAAFIKVRHHAASRFDETMVRFELFTDEMCGCKDKTCAQGVSDTMTKWATEMAKDAEPMREMTTAQRDAATKLGERMAKCMVEAMSHDEAAEYPSQSGSTMRGGNGER
jgi:hypothetical protein